MSPFKGSALCTVALQFVMEPLSPFTDMAPEVRLGGDYSQSADIYSFSLILVEMKWGRVDLFSLPGLCAPFKY